MFQPVDGEWSGAKFWNYRNQAVRVAEQVISPKHHAPPPREERAAVGHRREEKQVEGSDGVCPQVAAGRHKVKGITRGQKDLRVVFEGGL